MSAFCAIVLLSVMSQTFAQNFFQARPRFNNLLPSRAPGLRGIPVSSPDTDNSRYGLAETDLNSPTLSKFAAYNLRVQIDANIYPRVFDVSFSPNTIREYFYNEAVFFALENGVYDVGSLPQQLADAAAQALPNLTPLEYFKVVSNTFQLLLQNEGIGTEGNYKVLARLNAKAIEDAADSVHVTDAPSALHAIIVGAGTLLRSLSLDSPDEVRYTIATFADQLSRIPSTGGFQ